MRFISSTVALAALAVVTAGPVQANDKELRAQAKTLFGQLPKQIEAPKYNPTTKEKVELGKKLFFDPRLSASQSISCNSCHNLAAAGADNLPVSIGHEGLRGGRNSPTVLNAGLHIAQFWDGRAISLEDQAAGPITNPVEMAMPVGKDGDPRGEKEVLAVVSSIPGYQEEFKKVFGKKNPISMRNITFAIAAFERTLVTPGRFDKFLGGDNKALTAQEKRGLSQFLEVGCAGCHTGPALGGTMFQKVGLVKPWPNQQDRGRFEVTGDEADMMMFKVPSLRNISMTQPYFHDASAWTLEEAVNMMAEHQLGQKLKTDQAADIIAFLKALDGDRLTVELPVLPPSSDKTPRPQVPAPSLTPEEPQGK